MSFKPVCCHTGSHFHGHAAGVGTFHTFDDELLHFGEFVGEYVENQFVVHLHNHTCAQAAATDFLVDAHHSHFDDIGGASL